MRYRIYDDMEADEPFCVPSTVLLTDRLVVRPFSRDDFGDLKSFIFDPEILRFNPDGFKNVKDLHSFLEECEENCDYFPNLDDNPFSWAIEYEGKVVGEIAVGRLPSNKIYKKKKTDWDIGLYNISWTLDKKFRNRGFATEAAKAVTTFVEKYCMGNSICTIYSECDEENVASRRVMEKIGMVKVFDRFVETDLGKRKWNCYVKDKNWYTIAQISCHHCEKKS